MLPPIICWGEVLWDRFPEGPQLGGAVANVAWHLAMLGAPVALVTRVGDDDDGREISRRLAARGVDTSLVQVDPARATGEVEVTTEHGEPRYRLVPDRAWEQISADGALDAIAAAPAFVFGTLAQRAGLDEWRRAVAAANGLKVCDPNLRPGKEDRAAVAAALEVADVVKLGEREVDACARAVDQPDLVGWLLTRREKPARLVALTRGPHGSTLHTAEHRVEVPAIASPGSAGARSAASAARSTIASPGSAGARSAASAARSTIASPGSAGARSAASAARSTIAAPPGGDNVGCGDAYLAVLVHGLVAGWPLGAIGEVAARWASVVAASRGATPALDADTIARLVLGAS